MIEGIENQNASEDRAVARADVRASATMAYGGNALAAMRSGNSAAIPEPNGQVVSNPGNLNGALPIDDPDYDPILAVLPGVGLPGVYQTFYRIGQPLGVNPLKP